MQNSGLIDLIGIDNLFKLDEKSPQESVQKAVARAKHLLNPDESFQNPPYSGSIQNTNVITTVVAPKKKLFYM